MAKSSIIKVFSAPIEKVYEVITDYSSYPQFVPGIKSVEIISSEGNLTQVKYNVNIIKDITYILEMNHHSLNKISWELVSGDILKVNRGHWNLVDLKNGKTEVSYEIELDIKGFFPKSVINALAGKNLPSMIDAFGKRVALSSMNTVDNNVEKACEKEDEVIKIKGTSTDNASISTSDIVKKFIKAGVGTAMVTEEILKEFIKEVPENKISSILDNFKDIKGGIIQSIKKEIDNQLSKIDLSTLSKDIADNYDLDINAKIKLVPKSKEKKLDDS